MHSPCSDYRLEVSDSVCMRTQLDLLVNRCSGSKGETLLLECTESDV